MVPSRLVKLGDGVSVFFFLGCCKRLLTCCWVIMTKQKKSSFETVLKARLFCLTPLFSFTVKKRCILLGLLIEMKKNQFQIFGPIF
jgi:hypothetical protein